MYGHTRSRVFPPQRDRVYSLENIEAFKSLVRKIDTGDWRTSCWFWCGKTKNGYGEFSPDMGRSEKTGKKFKKRWYRAHRYSWQLGDGVTLRPLSSHHDIDHMCHNHDFTCAGGDTCLHRRCVRPDHLLAASPEENYARMLEQKAAHREWKRAQNEAIQAPLMADEYLWEDSGDETATPYYLLSPRSVPIAWGLDTSWLQPISDTTTPSVASMLTGPTLNKLLIRSST